MYVFTSICIYVYVYIYMYVYTNSYLHIYICIGMLLCIAFAVSTGLITGLFLAYIGDEVKAKHKGWFQYTAACAGVKGEVELDNKTLAAEQQIIQDRSYFNDDSWWEVADDYGTSLYSELLLLINEHEDKVYKMHLVVIVFIYSDLLSRRFR
jgi:hypothetical protein